MRLVHGEQYLVFENGLAVRHTTLNEIVITLAQKYRVQCVLNDAATEPRYDAWSRTNGKLHLACDGDPNVAILDCVSQVRGRAPYLGG